QDDTEFIEQAAQGIGLHNTKLHQLSAYAVQSQHALLYLGLDGDLVRLGLLDCCPDCAGIGHVSLVAQYKRTHALRVQKPHFMTLLDQLAGPPMCTATSLDGDQRGRS